MSSLNSNTNTISPIWESWITIRRKHTAIILYLFRTKGLLNQDDADGATALLEAALLGVDYYATHKENHLNMSKNMSLLGNPFQWAMFILWETKKPWKFEWYKHEERKQLEQRWNPNSIYNIFKQFARFEPASVMYKLWYAAVSWSVL
tara:strand:+ start:1365 stop:1808 length:444 start_codon:yes stop_codon:yes gene_type:complete